MVNEQRLFDLFLNLCKINAPPLQERESVEWTKNYLSKLGLQVWEDSASATLGGNANNLFAKLPANKQGAKVIFLSAHFDTVEPTEGLIVGERHGEFYSVSDTILGADDKAGMAPAIEAVHAIMESDEPHGDVYLVFSCAEEIGLEGAFACDIKSIGADFGFVFDTGPPVGSFVNKVGSHDKMDVKVIGIPAHAGKDPERGLNAIQVAGIAIAQMKIGRIDEETTSNVGQIIGGTARNVVPAEVTLRCEARSMSEEKLQAQIAHMRECFENAAREWGAKVEIEVKRAYDGYHIPDGSAVVQCALTAASRLGFSFPLRSTLGGSDANAYNAQGVPTIVCGTGMKDIHTHDEHVSKKDLVDLARLGIELIRCAAS